MGIDHGRFDLAMFQLLLGGLHACLCVAARRQVRTSFEWVCEENWYRNSVEKFRLVTVELPSTERGRSR